MSHCRSEFDKGNQNIIKEHNEPGHLIFPMAGCVDVHRFEISVVINKS